MLYSLDMASGTDLWPQNHCVPSQPLCLTLHSMYFWHYTQCSSFLKRSECMSSQTLYVWHHMQYIWHHIHSLWLHTIVSMSWHKLGLWHHMYYIWCHPYCVYDEPSSISDLKHVTADISSTPYVITPSILKTSHLQCKISLVSYVRHHLGNTGHDIHTLW